MADQLKNSRSGKRRRTSVGEFRPRASRHLSVETIEGRLMLSVAPQVAPDPANTISLAPFAAATSGENTSGTAPATPPPSEQGGFISPSGPTVIQISGGNVQSSSTADLLTNVIAQQADYETLISRGFPNANIGLNAATDGINPVFIRFDFNGDEGGPIGIAPTNRSLGQAPVEQEGSRVSADRNRSAALSESSALASASFSKLSGEWARPVISEVAGGEPMGAEKHRSKPAENDFLPTSLPKIRVEHSGARHGTGADSANSDSVQSRETPAKTVIMRELREGDRLVDEALADHDNWTAAPKQSASSAQPTGIFAPNGSNIDSILDDQTTDQHHAPPILTLKPDDRPQKTAALKHTSMINLLRSSLSYEPVLVALLLDYVAVRYHQREDKKRAAGSALRPVRAQ